MRGLEGTAACSSDAARMRPLVLTRKFAALLALLFAAACSGQSGDLGAASSATRRPVDQADGLAEVHGVYGRSNARLSSGRCRGRPCGRPGGRHVVYRFRDARDRSHCDERNRNRVCQRPDRRARNPIRSWPAPTATCGSPTTAALRSARLRPTGRSPNIVRRNIRTVNRWALPLAPTASRGSWDSARSRCSRT